MTWIKTISPKDSPAVAEALMAQADLYPSDYSPQGQAEMRVPEAVAKDSIVMSHSLLPNVLKPAFSTFGELMNPNLPLHRRQHEMIAATVSALNRCFY